MSCARVRAATVVAHWSNITAATLLEWRDSIIRNFGERPQRDPRVARLLSSHHIARRVIEAKPLLAASAGANDNESEPARTGGVVNHTCEMRRGGVLSAARRQEIGC